LVDELLPYHMNCWLSENIHVKKGVSERERKSKIQNLKSKILWGEMQAVEKN
jgi:hypothetical protein